MANCTNCGTQINENAKFCPSCGTAVKGAPVEAGELQADPTDAEQNKGMAVIAYILFFVPLITGDHKKSPFVMFHTNQGTVLFLASFALMVVSSILMIVVIGAFLMPLFSLAILALCIIGIINAVKGRMKPLPLIGKFVIIK